MSLLSNQLYKQISNAGKTDERQTRMATISSIDDDGVYLTFYGESDPSQKPYKRISSYTPKVGDVVVLSKVGSSYVITGKVV